MKAIPTTASKVQVKLQKGASPFYWSGDSLSPNSFAKMENGGQALLVPFASLQEMRPLRKASVPRFSLLAGFLACGIALAGLTACRSAKPPPPQLPAIAAAQNVSAQAEKLSHSHNWPAAAQEWKRAADQFSLLNDRPQLAMAWHNVAEADQNLGKFEEAQKYLEQAAHLNQSLGRTSEWWRNQILLLQVESMAKQEQPLKSRIEKLTALQNQIRDPGLQGLFLNELGLWQQRQGDMQKAEATFRQAAQAFQSAKDASGVATVVANEARLQEAQTNYTAALQDWQNALKQFESLADPVGITAALAGLGRSYLSTKNFPLAIEDLRQAARNYETLKMTGEQAKTLELLSQALAAQGQETEAAAVRKQAQALQVHPRP